MCVLAQPDGGILDIIAQLLSDAGIFDVYDCHFLVMNIS